MTNITRRNYFKLIGTLSGLIILNTLAGCKKDQNENTIEYDENGVENKAWEATGNSKQFEPSEHFIYTIVSIDYKPNGQINIPEGYEYVSSENITEHEGMGSGTHYIKYNFINTVPVEALEYENTQTKEIAYPFSGTIINLENTASRQKTLS